MDSQQNNAVAPAPPCVMVIFGASGDLTQRKLIPALFNRVVMMTRFKRIVERHLAGGKPMKPLLEERFTSKR